MGPIAFFAADWGTSSLRVWAMAADGEVVAERRSDEGMSALTPDAFPRVLDGHVAALGGQGLPVVICGMAGARQGWQEAPYRDIPASPADIVRDAVTPRGTAHDVRILPGLARRDQSRPDVMRGEETQVLGLLLERPEGTGRAVMPGTHSKWVTLESGRVTEFSTVMTGELFQLLSRHSVLRHGIGDAEPSGDPKSAAFLAGLDEGMSEPARAVERLFSLRPRTLLFNVPGEEIVDRLSGLLIGAEVGAALEPGGETVFLIASGRMMGLYEVALRSRGVQLEMVDADAAVRRGLTYAARVLWPEIEH